LTASANLKRAGRKKHYGIRKDPKLALFLIPFAILTFLFSYVPLMGWIVAFYDYKPAIPLCQNEFVGLDNFLYFAKDKRELLRVVKNTVVFAGLGYLVSWVPMLLAVLLNEVKCSSYKRLVQTVTTFPNFISWVIVYSLAFQLFSYDGVVSTLLLELGLIEKPTSVLANRDAVYWFQTCVSLWKSVGWNSILYMAAISGVDQELYEAAAVDGANRFRRIWHITLPSLLPTFIVLQLLAVSSFVGVGFDQYYVFRNSVVSVNLDVIDVYTYLIGLGAMDYSYGTAIGIVKSAISLLLLFGTNCLAAKIRGNTII
jgi:putative aldouronate transport system permease protein